MVRCSPSFILASSVRASNEEVVALLATRQPEVIDAQANNLEVGSYVSVDEAKNVIWPFLAMKTSYFSFEHEAEAACSAVKDCVGYVQHTIGDIGSPNAGKFTLFTAGGSHMLNKNHDWIAKLRVKRGLHTDFKKASKPQIDDADQTLVQNPAGPHEYVAVAEANDVVWPFLAMDTPYFDTLEEVEGACNALEKCQGYVQHKLDDALTSGKFSTFTAGGKHRLTKENDWISVLKAKKSPSTLKAFSYIAADEVHDALYQDPKFYNTEAEAESACSPSENCRGYVHRILDDSPNAGKFSTFHSGGTFVLNKDHDWIAELKVKKAKDFSYIAADEAHDALYEDPKFYNTETEAESACSPSENCRGYVHRIMDDSPHAGKFSTFHSGGTFVLNKDHDWIAELKVKMDKQ